ncbi:hypothetical protein [Pseudoxanthomonas dokdonensis]|uniref:Permease n=1 Tax=Pseudoxanthomonas dokdonensis TaxID=344882 RepID=A0A0R0CQA6_9GAMM|nr:hypothetical protein [Pseudoxanthomonas dokdonensis]KRG72089.1 hypothetical protein ABB29_01140 [Pseudoxanthomonas dokdonensis]
MDFVKVLRSLEEILFEVLTWLVIYPRQLWKIIRQPRRVAAQVRDEVAKPLEQRYTDSISPALFLMLSVLLAHFLEILLQVALPKVAMPVTGYVFSNQKAVLAYRSAAFAIWPLAATVYLLLRQHKQVQPDNLRAPFSEQCYLVAPFAVALSLGVSLLLMFEARLQLVAIGLIVLASGWYLGVQIWWMRVRLQRGLADAVFSALLVIAVGLAINLFFGSLLPTRHAGNHHAQASLSESG